MLRPPRLTDRHMRAIASRRKPRRAAIHARDLDYGGPMARRIVTYTAEAPQHHAWGRAWHT